MQPGTDQGMTAALGAMFRIGGMTLDVAQQLVPVLTTDLDKSGYKNYDSWIGWNQQAASAGNYNMSAFGLAAQAPSSARLTVEYILAQETAGIIFVNIGTIFSGLDGLPVGTSLDGTRGLRAGDFDRTAGQSFLKTNQFIRGQISTGAINLVVSPFTQIPANVALPYLRVDLGVTLIPGAFLNFSTKGQNEAMNFWLFGRYYEG